MDDAPPDILRFGPFELNLRSGELRREGALVKLQGQPIELLGLLAEHAGEVVTREQIRARVWKSETFVDFDQGINACVRQIRTALGDNFETPRFIQTLPRRGYRFLAEVSAVRANGGEAAPTVAPLPAPARHRARGRALVTALAIAVTTAAFVGSRVSRTTSLTPGGGPVLVVLPYRNLSGDPSRAYLCDGFTEELITQLSRRYGRQLAVIARTTAMTYRDSTKGAREIAAELRADYVLEGSVRLDGERLRVTSQLVRAADEVHLWAGNHDRRLDDLLKVQSEVSAQVAGALALQILPAGSGEAAEATPAAWREYLRGRAALGEEDSPRPAEAQAAFLRAVAFDPGFARAWLALARTRWMLGATPRESAVASREDLAKSLDLDDSLAEAHSTLAEIRFYVDWDFEGARAEWERALELDPGSAGIRHEFAAYWGSLGRHDEALRLVNEALRLDPLSPGVLSDVGWYSYFARRYGDAILRSRETLSRTPGYFWAGRCIVLSAMLAGDPAAAVPVVRDEMKGRGAAPSILSALDAANAPAAVRAYWGWDLDRRLAHPGGSGGSPADVAVARLALGDREGALAGLEKAVNARWGWILPFLGVDPFFDTLRREPRFERLLDRIGRAGRG